MNRIVCQSFAIVMLALPALAQRQATSPRPPEEDRFDNTEFRSGLLGRDLRPLLEYYKRTRPPAPKGPDAELLRREELLAIYQDMSLPAAERVAALEEAMGILERVAREFPKPPQCWRWRLQFGKDLLFRRAEPYYNNILYRGRTEADARILAELSTRAEDAFLELLEEIGTFLSGVDEMSLSEFRRVRRGDVLKTAETVRPQAEYFLQWSHFYRALAGGDGSARQKTLLRGVVEYMKTKSEYVSAPHAETGVQAQSLLLVGMSRRLLGDYQQAADYLVRARNLVSSLTEREAKPVEWVFVLAQLELAKLTRDAGHFDLTYEVTEALEKWRQENMRENFALALAIALVEGDVRLREAEHAREQGDSDRADRLEAKVHQPLLRLLRDWPENQGDVFKACAALVDRDGDPADMDALERNAAIAVLLGEVASLRAESGGDADQRGEQVRQHLQRALEIGEHALSDESSLGRETRPFALFNVAVAHFQLGEPAEAVEFFARLVEEHPKFSRSDVALDYAVRIAADYYAQDPNRSDPRRLNTLVRALTTLVAVQPDSDQAAYWRYYLGDALAKLDRREEAADVFGSVPPGSENYCPARYQEVVQRWAIYQGLPDDAAAEDRQARLDGVVGSARACLEILTVAVSDSTEAAPGGQDLSAYRAGTMLLLAEAHLEPEVNEPQRTLAMLEGFDARFTGRNELLGRAWRLRILAHQRLGQLDEAGRIVDLYLQREPAAAGAVMDQLLRVMTYEARRLRDAGKPYDAAAAQSLSLARKLHDWARSHPNLLGGASLESFQVRLAGAFLMAGDHERALELVSEILPDDPSQVSGVRVNLEALNCYAESLYQLGRYEEAQPVFYRLWGIHTEGGDYWWLALLRSLQCHTEMGSPPGRLVQEIRRLRYTRPDMGGPRFEPQFDRLEQINTQRKAGSSGGRR